MRRLIPILLATGLMFTALPAGAGPSLTWAEETTREACDGLGTPLVNVTQHVTGDMDSGFGGG